MDSDVVLAEGFERIKVRCKNCGTIQMVVAEKLGGGGYNIMVCCEVCGDFDFKILKTDRRVL